MYEFGIRDPCPATPVIVPFPLTMIESGLVAALLTIKINPLIVPTESAVNRTVSVTLNPGGILNKVGRKLKQPFVLVTLMIFRVSVPVFSIVIVVSFDWSTLVFGKVIVLVLSPKKGGPAPNVNFFMTASMCNESVGATPL